MSSFVGFCGTGGTGKTTTAKYLLEHYLTDHIFLPSAARGVFKSHGLELESDQDHITPDFRWQLQKAIQVAHRQTQSLHRGSKVVADRTQIDQYCYALLNCHDTLLPDDLKWLEDLVRESLPLYHTIFYFPLVTYPPESGEASKDMRDPREGKRLAFDLLVKAALGKFGLPIIEVWPGDVKTRAEFIHTFLKAKGKA